MEELLMARVTQLRELDERLDRIQEQAKNGEGVQDRLYQTWRMIVSLRRDLQTMIEAAEMEYSDF